MINDANIIPIGSVPTYTRAIKIGNRVFPLAVYTDTSGGTKFYKCAAVHGPYDVETVVISGCPDTAANGDYLPTDQTTSDWEGNTYPVYANGKGWYYGYSEFGGWGITQDINNGLTYQGQVGGGEWYDWNEGMPVSGMTAVNGTATLDTDVPKTWDGYKAVLANGVYVFEDSLTTGLTYSDTKPQKYGIYNDGATMKLDWIIQDYPINGLAFYASLTEELTLAETGQQLINKGAELTTVNNIKCAKFRGPENNSKIDCSDGGFCSNGVDVWTMFVNLYVDTTEESYLLALGSANEHTRIRVKYYTVDGQTYVSFNTGFQANYHIAIPVTIGTWNTFTFMHDLKNKKISAYLGKTHIATESAELHGVAPATVYIGYDGNNYGKGFVNNLMVYTRALTEAEIGQLVDKFSPTA